MNTAEMVFSGAERIRERPAPAPGPLPPRRRLDPAAPAVENIARLIGAGALRVSFLLLEEGASTSLRLPVPRMRWCA
jgi:hypothetical protein